MLKREGLPRNRFQATAVCTRPGPNSLSKGFFMFWFGTLTCGAGNLFLGNPSRFSIRFYSWFVLYRSLLERWPVLWHVTSEMTVTELCKREHSSEQPLLAATSCSTSLTSPINVSVVSCRFKTSHGCSVDHNTITMTCVRKQETKPNQTKLTQATNHA